MVAMKPTYGITMICFGLGVTMIGFGLIGMRQNQSPLVNTTLHLQGENRERSWVCRWLPPPHQIRHTEPVKPLFERLGRFRAVRESAAKEWWNL